MNISPNLARFSRDVGIVAQTMLLAATEDGLGGCMIGSIKKEELKTLLQLPENIEPHLLVAMGKPDEEVALVPIGADGKTTYYRNDADVHYVPKRPLEEIVL